MVDLDKRVLAGSGMSMSFAMGQMVLAVLAWLFPYWRILTIVLYVPSFLFIFYYFVLVESVRWLLSKGRKKEAAVIIFKAAAANKRQLSPETIKLLTTDIPAVQPTVKEEKPIADQSRRRPLWLQVVRSRILMTRLVICSFWFISATFIYYGLSINSVSLAGNKYVNYGLTALVEVPGYVISIMTLDRFGRKHPIITAFFVCGVALITMPFVTASEYSVLCLHVIK